MNPPETQAEVSAEARFLGHLRRLAKDEDRGALAALRRGLGQPPGTVAEMHPHVVPYLDDAAWRDRDRFYIVGALFGLHSAPHGLGNMGAVFRRVADASNSESIEKRFLALLKSHREDLFDHLRHAVALAGGKDVPVNWQQLLRDLAWWDHEDRRVQRNWAREFWGAPASAAAETEATTTEGE